MAVKRATSDPGQRVQLTYQSPVQATNNQSTNQNQTQIQQGVTDNFAMTGGYSEDGGYFSPSLQDEVFQQVTAVPDSVLLHATQLDSIQVNYQFIFSFNKKKKKNSFKVTNAIKVSS